MLSLALFAFAFPALAQPKGGGAPAGHGAPSSNPTMTGGPNAGDTALSEDQIKAQQHFQRAKELYGSGAYREAIAELEIARTLDPKAKDLVMNLGIVHEKLAKYDEAVSYFKSYLEMEGVTPAERAKVEGMIKRIEGAKKEAPAVTGTSSSSTAATSTATAPPVSSEPPPRGRIDAATIIVGSVAAVGIVGGTGLGIYALSSKPGDDFVTGRDGSYATLTQKTDDAHTAAVIADIGLGVGIVCAIVTAYLYFGRTKDPNAPSSPTTGRASSRVTFDPLRLRGSF